MDDFASPESFTANGFVIHPTPVVPTTLLGEVAEHMDAVIAGNYETGIAPGERYWNPGDDPDELVKIDFAHLSDRTLTEFVRHPAIGAFAASLLDAEMVQVWAAQLLYKPPSSGHSGNVGWHQDENYWRELWEGEVFTVWVAVADVTDDLGPLLYIQGSNHWGYRPDGNFFSHDLDETRRGVQADGRAWIEVPALLHAGGVSAHQKFTIHGSAANRGAVARRGFALHLRTERSRPVVPSEHVLSQILDNHDWCPIIYGA